MTEKDPKDVIRKIEESDYGVRSESYAYCGVHNRRHPQGSSCPECAAEAMKKSY